MSSLDDLFKKTLESQSEPYNPAAWENLSKRLDAAVPPRTNPFLKWGLPSLAVLVGAVATWYFTSGSEVEKVQVADKNKTVRKETDVQKPENAKQAPNNLDMQTPKPQEQDKFIQVETNNYDPTAIAFSDAQPTFRQSSGANDKTSNEPTSLQSSDEINNAPVTSTKEGEEIVNNFASLVLPTCENQPMEVHNGNAFAVIIRTKEQEVKITANSSSKIKLTEGAYEIVHSVSGLTLQNHVVVGVSNSEIVIGELYYTAGLPLRHASVKSDNAVTDISAQGTRVSCCSKEMDMLTFNKGSYTLSVETTNEQGCRGKSIETFYVAEDYNLLAVNAFEPLSQDLRKSNFIPFALTQRNTPFRMIIVDPSDGGIVYETSDALLPWDGIDKRNGKLADTNKAYVWKVSLSKPEPGEKVDYMGTIVRM
ncbi:MAG: hypothetical protein FJZ80_05965 [Bacteroidetes bacterium]|nr:hypothetical protein [Bacteroidota bacterium]MBM3424703.1 hypothetical protein [Bacteroidota bacterium]